MIVLLSFGLKRVERVDDRGGYPTHGNNFGKTLRVITQKNTPTIPPTRKKKQKEKLPSRRT